MPRAPAAKTTTRKTATAKAKVKPQLTVEELASRLDRVIDSTNDSLDSVRSEIQASQQSIMEAINALASGGKSTRAIDNPVELPGSQVDAYNENLGEAIDLSDEDGTMIDGTKYGDVENPIFKEKMEYEAFMKEMVEVQIHDMQGDENVPLFDISVNGRACVFRFGEAKWVPRYIVEGLARARPIHYSNEAYRKQDGSESIRHPARRGLRYPFSVITDKNPRGNTWLRNILAQP